MSDVQDFVMWFLDSLPDFLMSEPICYFWGFALLAITVKILLSFANNKY